MKQVVRALLKNDEWKYLLVMHHKSETWTLPGGHIEKGETLHQAIKREIREECNVKIKFLWEKTEIDIEHIHEQVLPVAMYKIKYTSKKLGKTKKCEYIFHAQVRNMQDFHSQEKEIKDYKWSTPEEIFTLENIFPQFPILLKKIIS